MKMSNPTNGSAAVCLKRVPEAFLYMLLRRKSGAIWNHSKHQNMRRVLNAEIAVMMFCMCFRIHITRLLHNVNH